MCNFRLLKTLHFWHFDPCELSWVDAIIWLLDLAPIETANLLLLLTSLLKEVMHFSWPQKLFFFLSIYL